MILPVSRPAPISAPSGGDRSRLVSVGLVCVIAGGAALRFWNLTAGFPTRIGVDEPVIAERALHIMKTGDYNPHFFDYPGLYIYVQALVGCARFLAGALDGSWRSLDEFFPEHLFAWTRALNAVLGTMTIFVVYRVGRRWGPWVALLAAALMAAWPNHVRESHFALTDVPLTLLTTLVLVLSLRASETGRLVWFVAAGTCVGLAAATKYGGAVALIMPLAAAAAAKSPPSSRAFGAIAATGAAAVGLVVGAPYTFLDLPGFLNAFGHMSGSFRPRPFVSGAEAYLAHVTFSSGWPGVVAVGVGMVWAVVSAVRGRDVAKWALILVFPLVYFHMIATKQLIFGRYMLPVVPFMCLLIATVVVDGTTWAVHLQPRRWARAVIVLVVVGLVLFQPVTTGIAWPHEYGKPKTQDVAYGMIREFIPLRSGVAVENSVLRLPDSEYRVLNVPSLAGRSLEQYVSSGVTYLVASSDVFGHIVARPDLHADAYRAYSKLLDEPGECLPTVEPTPAMTGPRVRICRLLVP